MSGGLDWPGLMRVGIVGLRLRPAEFWALTPGELALMLGINPGGARGLTRSRLEDLVRAFPDLTRETTDAGR
jgi:uncharacterized phage protein (TIGR02216 family)